MALKLTDVSDLDVESTRLVSLSHRIICMHRGCTDHTFLRRDGVTRKPHSQLASKCILLLGCLLGCLQGDRLRILNNKRHRCLSMRDGSEFALSLMLP